MAISSSRFESESPEQVSAPEQGEQQEQQQQQAQPSSQTSDAEASFGEGGYGWIVTASGSILRFFAMGIAYSWGVFQARLVEDQVGSNLALSAIGGVASFWLAFGCLPGAWILARVGPRKTAMAGIILISTGTLLSGFLTSSVVGLMFTFGVIFGFGTSLVFLPAYMMPSQWFSKLRGLSTGIVSGGGGIGGTVFAIVIDRLIKAWGMPWTFRFLGCLTLVVGLKPLYRSSRYIRIVLTCLIAAYPLFIPPYFIPQYTQSVGLTASDGALNAAIFNVSSAVGRVFLGLIADKALGNLNTWSLSVLLMSLSSLLIWPYAESKGTILLFVIISGLGSGGFVTLESSVLAQVVGLYRLGKAISWVEVAMSLGFLAGPMSAGALLDAFGGSNDGAGPYKPAMYLVGASCALAWILVVSVRISSSKTVWRKV